jgi:hypothetical protein
VGDRDKPFGPSDFPELLAAFAPLLDHHNAALVGGQALNVWATIFYDQAPDDLAQFAPYTSKDIDYYGDHKAAEALANALAGDVHLPSPDDQTPNTAVAIVDLGGTQRSIDFLGALAGVPDQVLAGDLATVDLSWAVADDSDVRVRLLHPLPILMSRAGNIVTLGRSDGHAVRQMRASAIVLREYVRDRLDLVSDAAETGEERADARREVIDIAMALLSWAERNRNARDIKQRGIEDPLAPLEAVLAHPGWDQRFLERTLKPRLVAVRARRARRFAEAHRKRARRPE